MTPTTLSLHGEDFSRLACMACMPRNKGRCITGPFPMHTNRTYNPEDGRALKKPATQAQAMGELVAVVKELKPDGFEPKIVKQTADYLYLEYSSPTFGVGGGGYRYTECEGARCHADVGCLQVLKRCPFCPLHAVH